MKQQFSPYSNWKPKEPQAVTPGNMAAAPEQKAAMPAQPREIPSVLKHKGIPLPDNYVDIAEARIQEMKAATDSDRRIKVITSTKLRNLFGLFSDVYNQCLRMDSNELSAEQIAALRSARVRIVYECGREETVQQFVEKTDILRYLYDIGSNREKLINYYHYLEALVAYARFCHLVRDEK